MIKMQLILTLACFVSAFAKQPPAPQILDPEEDYNVMDKIISNNDFLQNPELYEGDIIMTDKLQKTMEEMRIRSEAGMSTFDAIAGGVWPNGVVPYKFGRGFSYQSAVKQGIDEYNKKTCIRFKPYTAALARQAGGYVEFVHGGGWVKVLYRVSSPVRLNKSRNLIRCYSLCRCSSYIGRQRGRQQISLGRGCGSKGVAVHEMMHALGFYHEQSRRDRDDYITINWNNINKAVWYNFQKYRAGQASTLGEPYDKRSVMHYGNYAFSLNGQKTIVSKSNPSERLGQRVGLSDIDVKQLKKYYKCGGGPVVTSRPPTACSNLYPFCKVLTKWCTNQWVKGNCKQSCNLCNKPPPPPCNDKNKSGNCGYWTRAGYCKHKEYKGFMQDNCKKSCKLC
ncbi:zinc metalloproteinase nas-4-like isoform X2 [Hydractinia symbiolongicarpus]|uniref:zinc metalloproteinase nas-4-like isoform X2 n=1 Tax=Hydractinia symbiolongicarpus TaxID=13093 RepID=UPI00255062BF|nr:zinc metalloproteinase nas-4-like isoform X2 [Hydractinia symbiolongicarpus]